MLHEKRFNLSNLNRTSIFDLVQSFNLPKLCPNASWNPNATTFADNVTVGRIPHGIFVNTNNTVFVANRDTGNILIWRNGSFTPTINISSSAATPSCLFATADDQIFIDNQVPNSRVDRWTLNQTQLPSLTFAYDYCSGLFVDIDNNLYCSQCSHNIVLRKSLSSAVNTLTIVGGTGCEGSDVDMLKNPNGIFVTTNLDLYVADYNNDRIQRFRSGELNATTMAGNGSIGSITLSRPTGVVLDADGYLFIVDQGNHRIVGSSPAGFRCVVGCTGSGSGSNRLDTPQSLSFDTDGNMYPGRALLNPYTIVYDRAQPNTLRITVVFLRNTWLSITIVILRVVCGRS